MIRLILYIFLCITSYKLVIANTDTPLVLQAKKVDKLHSFYFQSLFSQYSQTRDFYRYYIEFLKTTDNLSLIEFRIRTQQFSNMLKGGLEQLSLTHKNLNSIKDKLGFQIQELENLSISYLNTTFAKELVTSAHDLKSQLLSNNFLIGNNAKLQIDSLIDLQNDLKNLEELALKIEKNTWQISRNKILLNSDLELKRQVKIALKKAADRLSDVRNSFTYSEATLVIEREKMKPSLANGSKKLDRKETKDLKNKVDFLKTDLNEFLESQFLSLKIINNLVAQSSLGIPPDLHLPPLSAHLFFSHTFEEEPKKISQKIDVIEPMPINTDWL